MADWAVIFDVDGVLLELTHAEEELFFVPFSSRCDASKLSRDWNSYRIRNDEEIVAEIVERQGLPETEKHNIKQEYLTLLRHQLHESTIASQIITGVSELLDACSKFATLGIATANFREAAKLRLENAKLWHHVSTQAFGADGGGHKHEILGRALENLKIPKSRTIYIGDNVNDVIAGQKHGVHFIGFSESQTRLRQLSKAGAKLLSSNHHETAIIIKRIMLGNKR